MKEPRDPRFQWGQPVTAVIDLFNDGSFPNQPPGALLAHAGDPGEIVQVGSHVASNTPVYLVQFRERCVVGCLEEEIAPRRLVP
jgi:nitrogen fixation protein NifZ